MPTEDIKMLEFNQYSKSDKTLFTFYADLEFLIKKIDGCTNYPEKLSTTNVSVYIPSGFSILTIWPSKVIENKSDVYRGCMKKFCESLTDYAMRIIGFKKQKTKEFIYKRTTGVQWKYTDMLYL